MRIELEKKIDHLFKNTRNYNDLEQELIQIGDICTTKEQYDNSIKEVWDKLVDKYILKQPFYEYQYKSYLMNDFIQIQIDAKLDKESFEEYKKNIEQELEIKKQKLQTKYNDESYLNDMRVDNTMIQLYKEALVETESELIKNPHYILDHMDKMKKKFYEYLVNILSNDRMNGIKKKIMLENEYTKYMSYMTGIEVIIPDELKYI